MMPELNKDESMMQLRPMASMLTVLLQLYWAYTMVKVKMLLVALMLLLMLLLVPLLLVLLLLVLLLLVLTLPRPAPTRRCTVSAT